MSLSGKREEGKKERRGEEEKGPVLLIYFLSHYKHFLGKRKRSIALVDEEKSEWEEDVDVGDEENNDFAEKIC